MGTCCFSLSQVAVRFVGLWAHARVCRIIVETDPTTIASRVSRPRADTTEIVITEQTILNAYQTVKEKVQQRIGQF